jgi:hypothetical protein
MENERLITCMAMHEDEDVDVYSFIKKKENYVKLIISLMLLTTMMIKEIKA